MALHRLTTRPRHMLSRFLINYLTRPSRSYNPYSVTPTALLRKVMRRGDILLVEGNQRFSTAIKYLTQSMWSHAAMFVGDLAEKPGDETEPAELVEANLKDGVIAVPLSKYEGFNTRICRPDKITPEDSEKIAQFMIEKIGFQYDLKNVTDLARYLLPTPPVPIHWRRRLLALGSGDPTRVICSTLIAQAFQSVKYPILPDFESIPDEHQHKAAFTTREVMHIRDYSLFVPRDFDISPYFSVVKPTIEEGFDYKHMTWSDDNENGV